MMTRSRRSLPPPTPPVTVTIAGDLRWRVAEALIEEIRRLEGTVNARGKPVPRAARAADELRDLYNDIVP
jgi:hypothetical protein